MTPTLPTQVQARRHTTAVQEQRLTNRVTSFVDLYWKKELDQSTSFQWEVQMVCGA